MAYFSFSEKLELLYLALVFYIRHIKQRIVRIYVLKWRTTKNLPRQVVLSPTDFHISDPTIAEDIYDGHISLAGISFNIGANSPFEVTPPNQSWYNELVSFEWLRHFKALNSYIAYLQANALFIDWQASKNYHDAPNWQLSVTSKRLIALLSHSDILLGKDSEISKKQYFKTIDQHVQILSRSVKYVKDSKDKLDIAIALCFAKTCLDNGYKFKNGGQDFEQLLDQQLSIQILPDGGHISRNPDILLSIMLELIPLKMTYNEQQIAVPTSLQNAIDRIIPILHFLCHPDGNFIQFNGAGPTDWAAFLSIFDAEGDGLKPPTQAPHSGYYRLYSPNIQVTIDAGAVPEAQYSTTAHAGPLAIEICSNGQRMVVNCGAAAPDDYNWFSLTRSTAAHSTLCIENASSAIIKLPNWLSNLIGNQLFQGHSKMPVKIGKTDTGAEITTSHDGYLNQFGAIHKRQISVSDDGENINGSDRINIKAPGSKRRNKKFKFDVRFHLHPSVDAQTSHDGHSILLTMPNQDMWQFVSTLSSFRLENSVYLGESHEKTKTKQIVISGTLQDGAEARWQFRRL